MNELTAEQIQIGKGNFNEAAGYSINREGFTRREFVKTAAATGVGIGSAYFGYSALEGNPVRVAFIGTGDEGSVLINEHPPAYMDIVAVADLRPENRRKAMIGDPRNQSVRMGLEKKLGAEKASKIAVYDDHEALLADAKKLGIEAVVVAVPLKGHAPVAMDCLDAGLHVLSEKLMAKTVKECKELVRSAREKRLLYAVGHQRHYNVLYENAAELIDMGLLGDIKFIRAQWHRNNSHPGVDSWQKPLWQQKLYGLKDLSKDEKDAMEKRVKDFGYDGMNKLVNWRIFDDTGGGLMAELGSHQLDACSIFLGKVHPIAVQGFGGKIFYGVDGIGTKEQQADDRDIDDHVFVTFEFPGKNYAEDSNDKCIVTYSSISTNSSEPYGEAVFGSRGTLLMRKEQEALLYKERGGGGPGGLDQRLWVLSSSDASTPVLDAYETGGASPAAAEAKASYGAKISRGYREEMEHFCWCIRNDNFEGPEKGGLRCNGVIAMADAIMALTSNRAMALQKRIEFKDEWFDPDKPDTPEADHPLPGEDAKSFLA